MYRDGGLGTQWDVIPPCRRCRRDKIYKDRYGITLVQAEDQLQKQGYTCGICVVRLPGVDVGCIDMDRSVPELRGIVCEKCSLGIRQFRHSRDWLLSAAAYLDRHAEMVNKRHSNAAGTRPY